MRATCARSASPGAAGEGPHAAAWAAACGPSRSIRDRGARSQHSVEHLVRANDRLVAIDRTHWKDIRSENEPSGRKPRDIGPVRGPARSRATTLDIAADPSYLVALGVRRVLYFRDLSGAVRSDTPRAATLRSPVPLD
jgi:hypothetical protein